MKKDLVYIYPNASGVTGIDVKIAGQIEALNDKYHVRLLYLLPYKKSDSFVKKSYILLLSQFRFIKYILKTDLAYYRYSPFMLLFNLLFPLISRGRWVWVEYNTVYITELELSHPRLIWLHKIQLWFLKRSKATHLAVTNEIKNMERLPQNTSVMPNGYTYKKRVISLDNNYRFIVNLIRDKRNNGHKILIFVGNNYPWHGIDRICDLIQRLDSVFLVLVGKITVTDNIRELEKKGLAVLTGYVPSDQLGNLLAFADFGLGTFGLDKKKMSEACPLKVREYLCMGLPTVINYYDPLLEAPWARGLIHKVDWDDIESLNAFLNKEYEKQNISTISRGELDWRVIFERAGVL